MNNTNSVRPNLEAAFQQMEAAKKQAATNRTSTNQPDPTLTGGGQVPNGDVMAALFGKNQVAAQTTTHDFKSLTDEQLSLRFVGLAKTLHDIDIQSITNNGEVNASHRIIKHTIVNGQRQTVEEVNQTNQAAVDEIKAIYKELTTRAEAKLKPLMTQVFMQQFLQGTLKAQGSEQVALEAALRPFALQLKALEKADLKSPEAQQEAKSILDDIQTRAVAIAAHFRAVDQVMSDTVDLQDAGRANVQQAIEAAAPMIVKTLPELVVDQSIGLSDNETQALQKQLEALVEKHNKATAPIDTFIANYVKAGTSNDVRAWTQLRSLVAQHLDGMQNASKEMQAFFTKVNETIAQRNRDQIVDTVARLLFAAAKVKRTHEKQPEQATVNPFAQFTQLLQNMFS